MPSLYAHPLVKRLSIGISALSLVAGLAFLSFGVPRVYKGWLWDTDQVKYEEEHKGEPGVERIGEEYREGRAAVLRGFFCVLGAAIMFASSNVLTTSVQLDLGLRGIREFEGRLTESNRGKLDDVFLRINQAPTFDEALAVLQAKGGEASLPLINKELEPLSFALRPTSAQRVALGVTLEVLTCFGIALLVPFLVAFAYLRGEGIDLARQFAVMSSGRLRETRRYQIDTYEGLRRDPRRPILYLRSFMEDSTGREDHVFQTTAEEKLSTFYNNYGPMLAVGEPRETLPLPGALRLYFDDNIWEAGVVYLMKISQVVVIHAGIADGLLWELGVARRTIQPEKLVITFAAWGDLSEKQRCKRYAQFKKYGDKILGCSLPNDIGDNLYVTFKEGWAVTVWQV